MEVQTCGWQWAEQDRQGHLSLIPPGSPGLGCEGSGWSSSASHTSQELALATLMKFVQLEGAYPLEQPKWEGHYLFPRTLFRVSSWWVPGASQEQAI